MVSSLAASPNVGSIILSFSIKKDSELSGLVWVDVGFGSTT